MTLLDPNFTKFIIKWDGEGLPLRIDAEIQKETGEKVGRIESRGAINKKISLFDSSNSLILIAYKARISLTSKYEVKDAENNLIGTVEQKTLSLKKRMLMKNSNNVKILKIEGDIPGVSKIKTIDGQAVAEFLIKTEKEKKSFWKSIYHNICLFRIDDSQYDRKTLFGFFISFLSSFNDYYAGKGLG